MERINEWLDKRRAENALRELVPLIRLGKGRVKIGQEAADSPVLWDFSSNDYLGLSEHPELIKKSKQALAVFGTGAGAARLMSGNYDLYRELEEETAKLKNKEAALVFGSGFSANVGVIPAIAGRGDIIYSDRLNHASIYDGCKLSSAKLKRFLHNDLNHLEELLQKDRGKGQVLIVVESVYSMDGDMCPLKDLVYLKNKYSGLLMVDEAHGTGVFGENGGGIIEKEGLSDDVDIAMGTFSKALGSYGAYIATSREMISYLVNKARSFIFSTALPPAVVAASLAAVRVIQKEPHLRTELHEKVRFFKEQLKKNSVSGDFGPSQIVPIVVGNSTRAVEYAKALRENHVYATAVRPPTVPKDTARLRFSITHHLPDEVLAKTAGLIAEIVKY